MTLPSHSAPVGRAVPRATHSFDNANRVDLGMFSPSQWAWFNLQLFNIQPLFRGRDEHWGFAPAPIPIHCRRPIVWLWQCFTIALYRAQCGVRGGSPVRSVLHPDRPTAAPSSTGVTIIGIPFAPQSRSIAAVQFDWLWQCFTIPAAPNQARSAQGFPLPLFNFNFQLQLKLSPPFSNSNSPLELNLLSTSTCFLFSYPFPIHIALASATKITFAAQRHHRCHPNICQEYLQFATKRGNAPRADCLRNRRFRAPAEVGRRLWHVEIDLQ